MKSSHYSDQHLSSPVPEAKYKLVQSYYGMTIIINAHLQCRVQPVEQPSRNVTVLVVKQLVAYAIPSLLVGLRWWEGQEVWSKREGRKDDRHIPEVVFCPDNQTFWTQFPWLSSSEQLSSLRRWPSASHQSIQCSYCWHKTRCLYSPDHRLWAHVVEAV